MRRQLVPQQGQVAPKAGVDAGHPGQGAEEGMLLCLARVVLCSTVQRAGDDLAGIALPGAPLHVEADEAVPVQVAQLAVRYQPAIGPAWHRWTLDKACQDISSPESLVSHQSRVLRHFLLTAARMARLLATSQDC